MIREQINLFFIASYTMGYLVLSAEKIFIE